MKGDLQDLKHLVFELIRRNNLRVPDTMNLRPIQPPAGELMTAQPWASGELKNYSDNSFHESPPIIIDEKKYGREDMIDESFALEDMEKDMIKKSLKRHGGRRKEAALELGISERTLYRKIKQYDLG
jgi:transcriptional regulator with PAS, ATPase and Fis domain